MTAPPKELPFSKTRAAANLLFLSGDLPISPDGSVPAGIEAQTELVLQRIEATLRSENLTLADVVSVTAYLVSTADFGAFNAVYAKAFPKPRPVRTTVRSDLMLPGALLELTVIANRTS